MIIFVAIFCLVISVVSFSMGVTMGYMISENQKLKIDNMRWNLINQVSYSDPD